jgi:membrane fusion protein
MLAPRASPSSVLFRREVLEARHAGGFGPVAMRPPLSFTVWCVLAALIAGGTAALLVFGQYTKRTRVVGITVPAAGVLKLTTPQPGIVIERRVEEGQQVRAGQVLFVLSSERMTDATGRHRGAQSAILEQLDGRRASLAEELARRVRLLDEQAASTSRRLAALRSEAGHLRKELETQSAREASAAEQLARYEELARQNFVSPLTARQRRDDLLEQTSRRQALERTLLAVQREAGTVSSESRQIPLRAEQQQAELAREMASLQQDIVGAEAARTVVVTAPQDGVVTAIAAERGQAVGLQPLATLLPRDSPLQAHLYAPSRSIGFIEPGQRVRVRYAAYPFQKFGQYEGEVVQVSRTALAPAELPPQLALPANAEALYRITVRLALPHVMAYGRAQALAAGMQLEADVMQERRRLIEWVFEPLIALGRKL